MKRMIFSLLLLALLPTAALADPDAAINGYWRSNSGAIINVCYAGNPDTFTLVVNPEGQRQEYTAHWMQGFRVQFYYMAGNDKIYAVYDPDSNQISLSNEGSSWKATWVRQ